MIKTKKVKVPIYGEQVTFIAYDNVPQLEKWLKKNCDGAEFDIDFRNYDGGFFVWKGYQYITIEIQDKISPGVIAHECKHAVNDIWVSISAKLDPLNDEPECYLLTWYVNQVHKFLDSL